MSSLTAVQHQIIELIASGLSVTAAAAQHNLHRTTVHHWKRTNPEFAQALQDAKEDALDQHRAHCDPHAAQAITALAALLNDPKASPSVKLRAALFIINGAAGKPTLLPKTAKRQPSSAAIHHNSSLATESESVMNGKIQTVAHTAPQPGRNEKCPCGSNLKYKKCCWLRPKAQAA